MNFCFFCNNSGRPVVVKKELSQKVKPRCLQQEILDTSSQYELSQESGWIQPQRQGGQFCLTDTIQEQSCCRCFDFTLKEVKEACESYYDPAFVLSFGIIHKLLGGLYFPLALKCFGIPQNELANVTKERDVWGCLLSLLPPQPDLGYFEGNSWMDVSLLDPRFDQVCWMFLFKIGIVYIFKRHFCG